MYFFYLPPLAFLRDLSMITRFFCFKSCEVKMNPVFIPPFFGEDVKSAAERKVYEILKNSKMNASVLHSLGLPRHNTKVYGEVDFVVVCERGVACLEIKGGKIERKGGMWIYTDRYGRKTTKKEGPFKQVTANMFSLKKELEARFKGERGMSGIPVACGVVFPDIEFRSSAVEDIPEIVYDRRTKSMSDYINRIFDYWENRGLGAGGCLTAFHIDKIVMALRGDFQFLPSLSSSLDAVDEKLVRLTEGQVKIVEGLYGNERIMVEGCAGTGKTLLAVDFALKKAGEGRKILYLTFNKNLAGTILRKAGAAENMKVINIHALFGEFVEVDKEEMESDHEIYFSETLPRRFCEYLDLLPAEELEKMQYDTLVLDEGQDILKPEYLDALDRMLKGGLENGCWAVFYDENQNIFNPLFSEGLKKLCRCHCATYRLNENCRNTVQIGRYCEKASGIKMNVNLNEEGEEVREIEYAGDEDFKVKTLKILRDLETGGVRMQEVVFLSPKRYVNSIIARAGIEVSEGSEDSALPGYSTIQSFKGLDAKVIVFCDTDMIREDIYSRLIYIAATRARTLLYVLGNKDFFERFK